MKTQINGDEPAFPVDKQEQCSGLTIRAEFAKAAMQGLIASDYVSDKNQDEVASWAVSQANALIAELNK